ncbi:MAG: pyridoxal phosphate-dependent aminotransferase [Bacteroidia bacterium]
MEQNKSASRFTNDKVKLDILKKRAFNYRWAEVEEGVIPLTAADPDFPVAPEIVEAISRYSQSGFFSYGPAKGLVEFREAISAWYGSTKGVHFDPSLILPVNSAAFGLFLAAKTTLKKGDKAIILTPVDFLFRKAIENAGAEVVISELDKHTGQINLTDIRSKLGKHVKAIFICNPNNPLGKTMTAEDLAGIGALALEHNLWIISDEIWADLHFGSRFQSISVVAPEAKERIIIVSGLSKNFGLAGLRVGYLCTENASLYTKLFENSGHSNTAYGVSTLSQIAGTAALEKGKEWLSAYLCHLNEMRLYTEQRLQTLNAFESNSPDSTCLFFPRIILPGITSQEMCDFMLRKARVALVPGGKNWFEANSEGHVRICYSTSQHILQEAFDRMQEALK